MIPPPPRTLSALGCRLGALSSAGVAVGVALVPPGDVSPAAVTPRREEGLVAWQKQRVWPNVGMAPPSVHAWVMCHLNAPSAAWSCSAGGCVNCGLAASAPAATAGEGGHATSCTNGARYSLGVGSVSSGGLAGLGAVQCVATRRYPRSVVRRSAVQCSNTEG